MNILREYSHYDKYLYHLDWKSLPLRWSSSIVLDIQQRLVTFIHHQTNSVSQTIACATCDNQSEASITCVNQSECRIFVLTNQKKVLRILTNHSWVLPGFQLALITSISAWTWSQSTCYNWWDMLTIPEDIHRWVETPTSLDELILIFWQNEPCLDQQPENIFLSNIVFSFRREH